MMMMMIIIIIISHLGALEGNHQSRTFFSSQIAQCFQDRMLVAVRPLHGEARRNPANVAMIIL
jgi:hypothetical protein